MPENELLSIEEVCLTIPAADLISRPGVRVNCSRCGEEITNQRQILRDDLILCQACAGFAYYTSLEEKPPLSCHVSPVLEEMDR
jgi:formylmethanofuran dehydrogenase subunit E